MQPSDNTLFTPTIRLNLKELMRKPIEHPDPCSSDAEDNQR